MIRFCRKQGWAVNPLDSHEAKPYETHPEIVAMTNLFKAYGNKDIVGFVDILKANKSNLMNDQLIKEHIDSCLERLLARRWAQYVNSLRAMERTTITKSHFMTTNPLAGKLK